MTPNRRVVVTGVGLVSPVGIGTEETWQALLDGRSGAGPITLFDASQHSTRFACEVKGFDPLRWIEKKDVKKVDRFIQFAIAAADLAMKDAAFAVDPSEAGRVGVFIGSGIGGFATIEREHEALLKGGPRKISPFFIPAAIINLASGWVSIRTGAKGPNSATATACASGAHAVGDSFRLIQHGDADVMIAGGSEAAITPLGVGGFCSMRALSTRNDAPEKASRPFDKDRDGFVIGEGSGILVLEELEHARRPGREDLRRGRRVRDVGRRVPHLGPQRGRRRGGARHAGHPGGRGGRALRGRLHQRPRHVDPARATRSRRSPPRPSSGSTRGGWP